MKELLIKEINRLVNKYPWSDSKDLFRTELELLVTIAEREQIADLITINNERTK